MRLMPMTQINDSCADARYAGREAFRIHGVTGETKHSYPKDSHERLAFREGFSNERFRAGERAQAEAVAYHELTVREAPKDRAWAEKLAARSNAGAAPAVVA